ncbi:RNA-binding S4 domain-containing protein [Sphingobium boeckii]|uniref:Ribosome-associated heat shock protein Hsp15 n=1 Tax=Sphingobium boeckii TaxID=1082345 RepID=A0A7W9ECQ9_9SPHN|nr:S4 domain-containing protein [Sphingobium boeckii]MBB5684154.1 ribosome-associated heat shock protein Hsp15 [Sphingobium boeckii]
MGAERESETQRIDRFLWFARLCKSRSAAQALCEKGHIRLDGRRIDRAHCPVRTGSVLTLPLPGGIRLIRIDRLPVRRGPPVEAATLYVDLAIDPVKKSSD